ncbi:hypothetical protein L1987_49492 [Smallanthus sonchifolius]|uniref:Uncharacterized protein n=1 Tax=Smallanthus sonchifolius TaxID=185202 RepID=A0ACB9FVG3_9ASTR|nr:hypothetical protein L1987_49492 [Smallanthus sonchifolius]
MFVGDSLSKNHWLSLLCMIHSSVPSAHYVVKLYGASGMTAYTFTDYEAKVIYHHSLYLVDIVKDWKGVEFGFDYKWQTLVGFDFIQDGEKIYKDMDRVAAFGKAIDTWGRWVVDNIDPLKSKVFFQGISPTHYK